MLLLAVGLLALPAAAQQPAADAAELGLEVTVGHGGLGSAAAWTPVEVILEPARLLQVDLVVATRSASGAMSEVRRVEVAARTRSVHRFVVPNGSLTVRVEEAGREPIELRNLRPEPDRGFAVGWLGAAVPDGAPALRSEQTGLTGTWVAVDPAWLGVSPAALDPLGALVAPASALGALPSDARAALRVAVVAGAHVVVVADTELPDLGLPLPALEALEGPDAAWAMPAADLSGEDGAPLGAAGIAAARTGFGRGTVATVAAAPGEGALGRAPALWALLVGPPQHVNIRGGEWAADVVPFQLQRVFTTGGETPALPWLALFTVAYVVVVGPVNGLVLGRMGRRELAWATVPIVTVVFSAGAFLGVTGSRPAEGFAGRALVAIDGVGTELVAAGMRAPTEGTREIRLAGSGWTARTLVDGGRPATLRHGDDLIAELDLAGLQFGGLVASRPTEALPPLEITATSDADGVTATVRNTGGQRLEGVTVRVATATRSVGTLDPGEEAEVEVAGTTLPVLHPYRDVFEGLRSAGPGTLEALLRATLIDGSPGLAWVVGTLPGSDSGVRVGGAPAEDRGLLLGTATAVRDTGAVSPFALRREAFSPQRRGVRPSPLAIDDLAQAVLRVQLPPDAAGLGALRARVPADPGQRRSVDVWSVASGGWRPLGDLTAAGGVNPAEVLDPLGVAWLRVEGDLFPFDYSGASIDGLVEAP
jgi:hypothetical protein